MQRQVPVYGAAKRRRELRSLSRPPGQLREVGQRLCGLRGVAVAQRGVHRFARRVDVDARQIEPPLDGSLYVAQALHLLEWHPAADSPQPAAPRRNARIRSSPGELAVAKRALPEGPYRRRRQLARTVRDEPVDQLVTELATPDRE